MATSQRGAYMSRVVVFFKVGGEEVVVNLETWGQPILCHGVLGFINILLFTT